MSEVAFPQFTDLLDPDGPVAIVIKQALVPANEDDPIIFPPSYPITTFKGRVHTINDGAYKVSVELPLDPKTPKSEKGADQTAGYNIDRFSDGSNSCEVDSAQSQANRMEPEFKKSGYRDLVPQIEIKVGKDASKVTTVNLLDAGHRAGDAVVRFSSLATEFHSAFLDAKAGNHFTLATLAPTSLLFGVWDSRSTQVKVQRALKATIRARNIRECHPVGPVHSCDGLCRIQAPWMKALMRAKSDQNALLVGGNEACAGGAKVSGVMLTPEEVS